MTRGRTLGCDGLPMEFYLRVWSVLGGELALVLNSLVRMSLSFVMLWIFVLCLVFLLLLFLLIRRKAFDRLDWSRSGLFLRSIRLSWFFFC